MTAEYEFSMRNPKRINEVTTCKCYNYRWQYAYFSYLAQQLAAYPNQTQVDVKLRLYDL